ncbi:MAG: PAS domain S-box protein [Bacteroidetes bacterium]|nr:PAS domain S-box protein [Bacteroidota bacterium]
MFSGRDMWRWRKAFIFSLVICGLWAVISDHLITAFSNHIPFAYIEPARSLNNFIVPTAVFFILYSGIKKQQYQLILSEKQYRELFESNPNPMWIYDRTSFAFLAVNEAAIIAYGYSRDEFLRMTIMDIRPKTDHQRPVKIVEHNKTKYHEAGNWSHIRKSGEEFPVAVIAHLVFFNGKYCKMVMATDITKQLQHEQQLEEVYLKEKELHEKLSVNYQVLEKAERENRLMGQVIDKINNMVLIVAEGSKVLRVNQAFIDFTGYTREEVVGKNPQEFLHGPGTDRQTVERLIQAVQCKEFFSGELINYKKNGEAYWTSISITPIFDENGVFQFNISVESVVTEKKEREQKILAQHAALQRIAWYHSHELRRPVCSIIGLISLLKDAGDPHEKAFCLDALEKCVKDLDSVIRDTNKKAEKIQLQDYHA